MPLDAIGTLLDLDADDPLVRLGITPLSEAFVDDYKITYRRVWMETKRLPIAPGPFEWRTKDYDRWKQVHRTIATRYMTVAERQRFVQSHLSMQQFLSRIHGITDDRTPVPQAVVDIAERVQREVPDARFGMDYFDIDPVLHVTYSVNGQARKAYLAIWEFGQVKAIADQPPPPEPRSKRWQIIPAIGAGFLFIINMAMWG